MQTVLHTYRGSGVVLTGPGPGKIPLDARVYIVKAGSKLALEGALVYLHVRGWSRARVTHLDVEHPGLPGMLSLAPREGLYGVVSGTGRGLVFEPFKAAWRLEIVEEQVIPRALGRCDRVYGFLGGKIGGVFIGLQSRVLRVLESIASRYYGVVPRRKTG